MLPRRDTDKEQSGLGIPERVSVADPRHKQGGSVMRGYACIALHRPKTTINVGSAMRAAYVYDARLIVTSGRRYSPVAADTMKAYRHIPFLQAEDVFEVIPYDCIPVAVDLVDEACPLPRYRHPERAFYVFGPEDGTLGHDILSRCRDKIMVPTRQCMNLAATVNVVLYDRLAKQQAAA
jgi:tRNA(Leu) C34 or U34 (ribose-2'-O)-methylase TrmL